MTACPHCGADGISAIAKIWSGSASPATCRRCGDGAYVRSMSFLFVVAGHLLLLAALFAALWLGQWWPLALFGLAIAGWVYWLAAFAPLVPVSAEEAVHARRTGNRLFMATILLAALAYWISR